MRLALANLDATGIVLDLAPLENGTPQQLRLRDARALKGTLEQGPQRLKLSGAEGEWVELEAATMTFGTTKLSSAGQATFSQIKAAYEQTPGAFEFQLGSHAVHVGSLRIEVGSVDVFGELRLQETQLLIDGAQGRIEAKHARIEGFRLKVGEIALQAVELLADSLLIGWGPDGFRLEATHLSGPHLRLQVGTMSLDAERVAFRSLLVHGATISFAEASLANAQLEVSFEGAKSPAPEPLATSVAVPSVGTVDAKKPIFDWQLLDGLSGSLNVDAVVDMTVPIIGQRRATHKLRLSVEDGALDYREIEKSLSALEESLLDFAVRDGALVLERGIPLLPTRGFGKRLLIWDLSPDDLLLAHKRRIRISVLPSVRLADELAKANAERELGASSFALRRLGLENMDLKLSLNAVSQPVKSAIEGLSFERLAAYGNLQHELQGEPRAGVMHAQFDALSTGISGLMLGKTRVDVKSLELAALRDATLSFVGLSPSHLRVEIAGLAMRALSFVPDHD